MPQHSKHEPSRGQRLRKLERAMARAGELVETAHAAIADAMNAVLHRIRPVVAAGVCGLALGISAPAWAGAVGTEFLVNTVTTGNPSIAVDADGDFVVVWESDQGGGFLGSTNIYAQRYNAAGVPQGAEFRVNTFTTSVHRYPAVAMDADGDFLVAWTGNGSDILAQRYNAAGVAQGAEFLVNTFTTGNQSVPSVAMDADGDFVVAWQSNGQDGNGYGIYAQRYNAAGVVQGVEFRVNTFTTGNKNAPSVAMDADGDFVVAWTDSQFGLPSTGIYAQRYSAAGVAQGPEFRINTLTTGQHNNPSVAVDADGDFVVAWGQSSNYVGGAINGIVARRYNSAGVAQGAEFRVGSFGGDPSVAMDADGDFVVAGTGYQVGDSSLETYAQRYSAGGVALGAEFRVNTFTTGSQFAPSVAMDADGDFVVAWVSSGQDGSQNGIYAQRYAISLLNGAPTDIVLANNTVSEGVADALVGLLSGTDPDVGDTLAFSFAAGGADNAAFRISGNQLRTHTGLDFEAKSTYTIRIRGTDMGGLSFEKDLTVLATDQTYEANAVGSSFSVNTYTRDRQQNPSVAVDADGDFVVAWQSRNQDGSGYGIYAQRYNSAGLPQGLEFRVNTSTLSNQRNPGVAMDADGDFVVVWQSYQDGGEYGIYAQRYNAAGVAQGTEFRVNTLTANNQLSPAVAMDADGDFVVAWQSYQDGSENRIYAQRFNAAGVVQGAEFRVNTFTSGEQVNPAVAVDADGDFVVTWQSASQDGSGYGIYAQRYNAAGVAQGVEFIVNTFTTSEQRNPSVAMDADGDFVVAWESSAQDGSGFGIYAQRYNAAGVAQGVEFLVNTTTNVDQSVPSVAMDADGDFVVAWNDAHLNGYLFNVYAQRYNQAGVAQGVEFRVNTFKISYHDFLNPVVAMDVSGDFVVAWNGDFYDSEVYTQRYQAYKVPTGNGEPEPDNDSDGIPNASDPDNDNDGFSDELEIALGTDPLNSTVTPTGGTGPSTPGPLPIKKLAIGLSFAAGGKDTIQLSGALPIPAGFTINGKRLVVDVGGVIKTFTLNTKGTSLTATESAKVTVKAVKGVVPEQSAPLTVKFKLGTFAPSFANESLTDAIVIASPRTVRVTVLLDTIYLAKDQPQSYTAGKGKGRTK